MRLGLVFSILIFGNVCQSFIFSINIYFLSGRECSIRDVTFNIHIHIQISYFKSGPNLKIINLDLLASIFFWEFVCFFVYLFVLFFLVAWFITLSKPLNWTSKYFCHEIKNWLRSHICTDNRRGMLKYKRKANFFIFLNIGLIALEVFKCLLLNESCCVFSC